MASIWSSTLPEFPALSGDITTDVLVIGGGIAGILCAHTLSAAGIPCVVAEAQRICSGITKNTTAKITAQHGLCYAELIRRFGLEKAQLYYRANHEAIAAFRTLSRSIACDFEEQNAYVYSRSGRTELERELAALERIGADARFVSELPLPFPTTGAVCMPHQAQFHPLKFVGGLAGTLKIYEHTRVSALRGTTALTPNGEIHARKIIVCTHFPFSNLHGSYFLKLYQQRSYVLALENAQRIDGMYLDAEQTGLSLRSAGDCLLFGGAGHRTGKPGGAWQQLRLLAMKYYPNARERCAWATQDCMSLDGVPYIGNYSALTPDVYVATGFNKWGMTSAMVAARLLCDLIQGRQNDYASLFSPSRSILRWQLAVNGFEAVRSWLTPSLRRCPHLGCALKWNPQEHSWDCPCHGSRFEPDGKLIDNPATGDLKHTPRPPRK